MGEYVSTFQSVVEAEQQNGGTQKKRSLAENENPARRYPPTNRVWINPPRYVKELKKTP